MTPRPGALIIKLDLLGACSSISTVAGIPRAVISTVPVETRLLNFSNALLPPLASRYFSKIESIDGMFEVTNFGCPETIAFGPMISGPEAAGGGATIVTRVLGGSVAAFALAAGGGATGAGGGSLEISATNVPG